MSDQLDKRFVLAVRAFEAGLFDAAESDLTALLTEHPDDERAKELLAAVYLKTATAALQRGEAHAAVERFKLALDSRPDDPDGWSNLGLAYQDTGALSQAQDSFLRALDQDPNHFAALNNLGLLRAGQGQYAAATDCFEKALAADPNAQAGWVNRAMAQLEQGDVEMACRTLDTAQSDVASSAACQDVRAYAEVYVSDDASAIRQAQSVLTAAKERPAFRWDGERPLRVGFVSADFRRHSVAFFSQVLFRHLPSDQLHVIGVSNTSQTDDTTGWFRNQSAEWVDISGQDDEAAAQAIQAAEIDILVDLSGRTIGHRQGVFARRPAPLQMTALGYPATTGASYFDGRWIDGVTDPDDQRDSLSEGAFELSRLHHFTPGPAPDVSSLPDGPVKFVSFNKWAKVSPRTLDLWSRVLNAVPGSRLLLKAKALTEPQTQAHAVQAFEARGIEPDQIELQGWTVEDTDHLSLYGRGHIALDSFPYNGTTTTCEALWMGVPVLTLCGQSHASRVSASLLTSAGLTEWISHSEDEFVERAVQWAQDRAALGRLRASLRATVQGSALCDGAGYARDLERRLLAFARSFLDQTG